jgi:hypothetical protein
LIFNALALIATSAACGINYGKETIMKPKVPEYSFSARAAEKAAARAVDEEQLRSGKVSRADMARANGGFIRGARYIGPSKRIQALAAKLEDMGDDLFDASDDTVANYDKTD